MGVFRALPRIGAPFAGEALGGSSAYWFDQVMDMSRTGQPEILGVADLDRAVIDRISAPRPRICGMDFTQPRIMGVLNVTPDSFSDGGDHKTLEAAVDRARVMAGEVDVLDIGGESTRPGALEVDVNEEISRTAPVISAIRQAGITTPISIDTRKSAVAEAALEAGANMVNDVSAFTFDERLADVVAARQVPVCLMHAQGVPAHMQDAPRYENVVLDVFEALKNRVEFAQSRGINRENIIVDPGIGFGKTLDHNMILLRHLSAFHDLGLPLLLGVSRKRFNGTLGEAEAAKDRVAGSVAVALHGISQGAHILRVHDTFETRQAMALQQALTQKGL